MDEPVLTVGWVVMMIGWFAFCVVASLAFGRAQTAHRRSELRDVLRTEEGASLQVFGWSIASVGWIPRTAVDLFLTEEALYVEPAASPHFVAYAIRFGRPADFPQLAIPGARRTVWLSRARVDEGRLKLDIHQPLGRMCLTLVVSDPESWRSELERLLSEPSY